MDNTTQLFCNSNVNSDISNVIYDVDGNIEIYSPIGIRDIHGDKGIYACGRCDSSCTSCTWCTCAGCQGSCCTAKLYY